MGTHNNWDITPGFDRPKEKYLPLDLGEWLAQTDIEQKGRARGLENQPSPHAKRLDSIEDRIVERVLQRGTSCRSDVSSHLSDLVQSVSGHETQEELTILENETPILLQEGLVRIRTARTESCQALWGIGTDFSSGRQEMATFKEKAGLKRAADYSQRRFGLWWIVFFWVIESILNGTLLMESNPFGLVGSICQMALISAVNVLMCGAWMGGTLRVAHLKDWSMRIFAGLSGVITLGFVGFFNLGIGHFRDSIDAYDYTVADTSAIGSDALQRFMTNPFELASFLSWLLVIFGVLFFGVSAWKWLKRDDVHPGYGKCDRRLRRFDFQYRRGWERATQSVDQALERTKSRLEDRLLRLRNQQSKWRETEERGHKIVEDYPINMARYQRDLNFLLSTYRDANRQTRTEPEPAHFAEREYVDQAILEPPSFDLPAATRLETVAQSVIDAISTLQKAHANELEEIPTLESLGASDIDEASSEVGNSELKVITS